MVKSRRAHRTSPRPLTPQCKQPNRHGRAWWPVIAVALAVVLLAIAWQAFSSRDESETAGNGEIQPVAQLEAPDFHSLLIDPANADRILFGSHAGLQESQNGGVTWQEGTLRNADAMNLATSPNDAATIYVAGHDVFHSSQDGGQSWAPVQHNLPGTDIHGFAQDPADPKRLYAYVVSAGLLTSIDGGTTWSPLTTQPPSGGNHLALVANTTGLYVTTATGLVLTRNQGETWEAVAGKPGPVISLAAAAQDSQLLYAGTQTGLLKSTDAGATWSPIGLPGETVVAALAVAPTDPSRVLFVTPTGALYRSDDGGSTWL